MIDKLYKILDIAKKALLATYLAYIFVFISLAFLLVGSLMNSDFFKDPFYILFIVFLLIGIILMISINYFYCKKTKDEIHKLDFMINEYTKLLKNVYFLPLYVWKKMIKVTNNISNTYICEQEKIANDDNMNVKNVNVIIKTNRLILRNFINDDLETVFKYRNNKDVNKYQVYDSFKKEDILMMFENNKNSSLYDEIALFAIAKKENNEIIGEFYISNNSNNTEAFLGFTIAPEFQRQGFAYEIISEIIVEIVTNGNIKKLFCSVYEKNIKSINLIEKLEFKKVKKTHGEKGNILIYEKKF